LEWFDFGFFESLSYMGFGGMILELKKWNGTLQWKWDSKRFQDEGRYGFEDETIKGQLRENHCSFCWEVSFRGE
jgi:hypothetical protein